MQLDCSGLIFLLVKVPAGKYFPRWATGPIRAVCQRGGEGAAGDFGLLDLRNFPEIFHFYPEEWVTL